MLTNPVKLRPGPVLVGEALGAHTDLGVPLELNTAEMAACPHCGREPRLHTETSPKGRTVAVWIPVDHACRRRA